MAKGVATRDFYITNLGEESFPIAERFERRIAEVPLPIALGDYKDAMTTLADKYGIPEDRRKQFMAVWLNPLAAKLFGLSDESYEQVPSYQKIQQE